MDTAPGGGRCAISHTEQCFSLDIILRFSLGRYEHEASVTDGGRGKGEGEKK